MHRVPHQLNAEENVNVKEHLGSGSTRDISSRQRVENEVGLAADIFRLRVGPRRRWEPLLLCDVDLDR